MDLRVALIDDEELAIRRLELALATIGGCQVVGKASDGDAGRTMVDELAPDVLIVDIHMPGLDGIQLVESLEGDDPPVVIFATAFEQFAIRAFESGAVDYLLKPIDEVRLAEALKRAVDARQSRNAIERIAELRSIISDLQLKAKADEQAAKFDQELWIASRQTSYRVPLSEVRLLSAAGDYVVVTTEDQEYLHYDSLRSLEERLDPDKFVRIHRSAIAALSHIVSVERTTYGGLNIVMDNGATTRCSRAKRERVESRLGLREG